MICVYDKMAEKGGFWGNGLAVLDECISASIDNSLNGDYSLELIYPASSHKAKYLEEFAVIKAEEQLFRIYKAERSQDKGLTVRVWARHIFCDLAFYFVESAKILNANMAEAIEMTIPPEVQAIYTITAPKENIAPFAVKEVNSVDAFFKLIEVYGGELNRDNYSITVEDKVGADSGITVRYGKNIKGLTLTLDSANMATKIYPVGASGLVLPERYIEVKGVPTLPFEIVRKAEFSSCSDVETLRNAGVAYAEECAKPKINISIDFLELSKTDMYKGLENLAEAHIGDFVTVIHEKLGITAVLRVIRKQIDLLNPINTKIELGDPLKTIIDKMDTDSLFDEIKRLLESNKSGVIIKKNPDVITIGTSKYAAMVIGFTTKADTNLNCTITLTGKATADTTLSILFSLDGVVYDLKPVQKLAQGDNVLGFTLPMPQVPAGSHSFVVETWVSNDQFIIEKNNLQISIEGLNLEGGLSATLPRIEVFYGFLFNLFARKMEQFKHSRATYISKPNDSKYPHKIDMLYSQFRAMTEYSFNENLSEITLIVKAIFEEFSRFNSTHYAFDNLWVEFDSESEKVSGTDYIVYNRVTIKEPVLSENAVGQVFENGAIFSVSLPNKSLYNNLIKLTADIKKEMN